MGTEYKVCMEAVMREYERAWVKAYDEYERHGEVRKDTDYQMRNLEAKIAMIEGR